MSEFKPLLLRGAGLIGLQDDIALIAALGALGRNWIALAAELRDVPSALVLIRAIADGTASPAVAAAFARRGATSTLDALTAKAGQLDRLLAEVPESVGRLLAPIGSFDERQTGMRDKGLLAWSIIDKAVATADSGAAQPGTSEYALSLGAKAALAIEAGDVWPYSDPLPGALLRFRAEGGLTPSGSARIPFTGGSAEIGASGAASFALEYYYDVADPNTTYAIAVAERLGRLPDPFDFDSIWHAFSASDLAGIHYIFTGSAAVNVAVAFGDAVNLGAGINASLGATIAVGFTLGGSYNLTFRGGPRGTDGERQVIASLSRQKSDGQSLDATLGVTVDLSSIVAKVHAILGQALSRWDDILKDVKPLLSPGTWLRDQAAGAITKAADDLIADPTLKAAVIRDLQGTIGLDPSDDSALAAWLSDRLTGAIDNASGWAEAQADGAVTAALDTLGRTLPAFAEVQIRALIEPVARTLIGNAAAGLETTVKGIVALGTPKALGKALGAVGARSDKAVETLDDALAEVRALIARYDALFRKIVAATADAARARIAATVQIEESRTTRATAEIEATFTARSDAARDAFRALTRGDLDTLIRLIADDGGSGITIDRTKSKLDRYSQSKSGFAYEVVLFGFGISGGTLLTGEADVIVDGTGQVQVDAAGSLEKRFHGLDAEREIEIVSAFSLVRARALATAPPAADRTIGLAVTIGHVDDGLKRHEVERFVGSLTAAKLLPASALDLAALTFNRWTGTPGGNGKLSGSLILKLALDRPSLATLLQLDAGPAPLAGAAGDRITLRAFARLRQAGVIPDKTVMDGASIIKTFGSTKFPNKTLADIVLNGRKLWTTIAASPDDASLDTDSKEAATSFLEVADLASGMRAMIEELRRIYFSTPETQPDDDPLTWSPQDYRKAEKRALDAVSGWLRLNAVLFWTNSKVYVRTIAFLESLLELAGLDAAQAFSLTFNRLGDGVTPETVVLTTPAPLP